MPAPKTSKRPPSRPSAPRTSPRPKVRPADVEQRAADMGAVERGNRAAQREAEDYRTLVEKRKCGGSMKKMSKGGKAKKMASGGMCRGMGAASKGGRFVKNG